MERSLRVFANIGYGQPAFAGLTLAGLAQANPVQTITQKRGNRPSRLFTLSDTLSDAYTRKGEVTIFDDLTGKSFTLSARDFNASGSFKIPEADKFLKRVGYRGSPRGEKKDIRLTIFDTLARQSRDVTFSIKSYVGGDPSLFNAGTTKTNLRYRIEGSFTNTDAEAVAGKRKFKDKPDYIAGRGADLEFDGFVSDNFKKNLRMSDSDLPALLPPVRLLRYSGGGSDIPVLTSKITETDPLGTALAGISRLNYYEARIKKMLFDMATGMTAETEWDGNSHVWGGMIVVNKRGDILAQHIYDLNAFRDYLYRTSRFDTPSTASTRSNTKKRYPHKGGFAPDLGVRVRIKFPKAGFA